MDSHCNLIAVESYFSCWPMKYALLSRMHGFKSTMRFVVWDEYKGDRARLETRGITQSSIQNRQTWLISGPIRFLGEGTSQLCVCRSLSPTQRKSCTAEDFQYESCINIEPSARIKVQTCWRSHLLWENRKGSSDLHFIHLMDPQYLLLQVWLPLMFFCFVLFICHIIICIIFFLGYQVRDS